MTTRLCWLDAVRVCAAFAVVCSHVSTHVLDVLPDPGTSAWWAGNLLGAASRWGVDVFLLVSGALLLDPSREEPLGDFYRKRFSRVFIPLVFWSALYLGLRAIAGGGLTWRALVDALLTGRPYYHLWYLYMIPALYFYTPFLRRYIAATPARERRVLTGSLLALAVLYTFFRFFYRASVGETIFTLFVPFLGLFLAGHEWRVAGRPQIAPRVLWAVILLSWSAIVVGSYLLVTRYGPRQGFYLYDRLSPFNIAIAMSIFALFYRANMPQQTPAWLQGSIQRLYPTTLGIYLIHPLFLAALERLGVTPQVVHPAISQPLEAIGLYLVSYLVVSAMLQVPYLRRTVC